MGTFMDTSKRVIIKSITINNTLELDTATTLPFLIYERHQNTPLSVISYQLEKVDGRTTTILQAWADVSLTDVEDDLYTFDVTATGVTKTDRLLLRFKIVDTDGIETFRTIDNITVVV